MPWSFSIFFISSFNGKPRAQGVYHRCMTVNAQLSSSSWSWQASPQDHTAGLPTLSRASPRIIYPCRDSPFALDFLPHFRDSPFALDYLPRFRDSLALQVIRPFRDNPTISSFMLVLLPDLLSAELNPLTQPLLMGKAFPHFLSVWFHIIGSNASNIIFISYHSDKNSNNLIFKYQHLVFKYYVTNMIYSNIYSNMAYYIQTHIWIY